MAHSDLDSSAGTYKIIRRNNLTIEDVAKLRSVGRQQILDRLAALIGEGKVSVSQVQEQYASLMAEADLA
jgi:hypothetical protein